MTLAKWLEEHDRVAWPYGRSDIVKRVFTDGLDADQRWDLFHLSDYVVGSLVSGPAVVLWPRYLTVETVVQP